MTACSGERIADWERIIWTAVGGVLAVGLPDEVRVVVGSDRFFEFKVFVELARVGGLLASLRAHISLFKHQTPRFFSKTCILTDPFDQDIACPFNGFLTRLNALSRIDESIGLGLKGFREGR